MKTLLVKGLIFSLIFMTSFGFTNIETVTLTPDYRIAEAFGQKHVDFLLKNNPDLINYYNFYLEKVWKLVDLPIDKVKRMNDLKIKPEYAKLNPKKFNILLYDIKRQFETNSYYKYNGKVLVVLSEKEFIGLYNEYRDKQQ